MNVFTTEYTERIEFYRVHRVSQSFTECTEFHRVLILLLDSICHSERSEESALPIPGCVLTLESRFFATL